MRKSPHHFECRDDLWARVEALAAHRGVPTDEVVQAALLQLFLKRRKDSGANLVVNNVPSASTSTTTATISPANPGLANAGSSVSGARTIIAGNSSASAPKGTFAAALAARLAGRSLTPRPGIPNRIDANDSSGALGPVNPFAPPPSPTSEGGGPRPLYLFCEGSWYLVDREEFVIGRGRKYSDLTIKDANISRRHCAIVRRNGEYFMRDLGSTNGIEFDGVRVDDHRIVEGSVYQLCNHDLRFSFVQPDAPVLASQPMDDGE